jgi:hypothetical protein
MSLVLCFLHWGQIDSRLCDKHVTEFAIGVKNKPKGFQKHIWRYPVRFDIALEYLRISSDEYLNLFGGFLGDKDFLESVLQLNIVLPAPPMVSHGL